MRTEINYKKEGFSQIFPILYITNDKEKAWIFGFGKRNIAFVTGENDGYKEQLNIKNEVKSAFKGIDDLDYKEKALLLIGGLAAIVTVYYIIKKIRK